jgi:plastocyanin
VVFNRRILGQLAIAALVALAMACGGGYGGSSQGPSPVGGSPGPSGATITISNGAVNPSSVTISVGQSVTFVNNDTTAREMSSNPHPTHTDCPQVNALGRLNPNQTGLTNAFTSARTCGFHDHASNDTIPGLRGTIVIQ